MPTLAPRFRALPARHPADALDIAPGTLADYAALAEHHYRAGKPATATRVLVMRSGAAGLGERWRRMHPEGHRNERGSTAPPIAVLVESLPALSCKMRDHALGDRYGGWLKPAERARLLNDELRCVSRVVVHPQWRGLGLAVRLVRRALDTATTPYTEALAAMGRVSPFFERAGMTAYRRPPHAHDARLAAAFRRLGWAPADLALIRQVQQRLANLPAPDRAWIERELHRWYRRAGGRSFDASADTRDHLRAARDRLLLEPVYYLHQNAETAKDAKSPKEGGIRSTAEDAESAERRGMQRSEVRDQKDGEFVSPV